MQITSFAAQIIQLQIMFAHRFNVILETNMTQSSTQILSSCHMWLQKERSLDKYEALTNMWKKFEGRAEDTSNWAMLGSYSKSLGSYFGIISENPEIIWGIFA